VRFAYADPPYLGCGKKFYGHLHPEAADYDRVETHKALVDRLVQEFPDGWAMSLHSPSLRTILPFCPDKARVMAWVKPFAFMKPSVRVTYSWEPLIVCGGRRGRDAVPTRDACWGNPCGVSARERVGDNPGEGKPETFCFWMFGVLGMQRGDDFADLFPGSGRVMRAWHAYQHLDALWSPPTRHPEPPSLFEAQEHQA
jgi:hypothetical protein